MAITKVTNSLVATNAIQGTLIADNAITSVHIAQNQVTSVQIPDGSITAVQLGANSVDSSELVDGSIDTSHIANGQITESKLAANSVRTAAIAQNQITSKHIADGSITDTQLGSGAFTMGNITTTGSIRGPASLTIDPAAVGDNTGTVVIAGNLQVDGTTTTINSTTLSVADQKIELASGAANAAAANDSGITVTGANATLRYLSSGDKWSTNKDLEVNSKVNTNTINNIGNTANIIYRSSTNTIVGNNATALVVQDGGNIGIGKANPGATLDIEKSSGATLFMNDTNGRSLRFRTANSGSQNSNISSYSGLYLGGSDNASHVLIAGDGDVTVNSGVFTTIHDITTVNKFKTTNNNTRSIISMESKDSSGNAVDLRIHALGDGPRGEIYTYTNHPLGFATNNAAPQMTLDTGGRLGINQTPSTNNFTLQVKGIQTNGTDGRVAYFKGYGTATSIGTTGPTVVLQNANNTVNNYTKLSFESAGAGETVSINSHNRDHSNHYGDMAFNTRGSGGYSEKMRIMANGNVGIGTDNPSSKLHIDKSDGPTIMLTRTSANTSGNLGILRWGNTNWDSNLAEIVGIQDGANDSAKLEFKTQPTGGATVARMTISSDGSIIPGLRGGGAANVHLGSSAGLSMNSSAQGNTLIGFNAGRLVTSSTENTALGSYALEDSGSGSGNTAIGREAMLQNQSGTENVAVGKLALAVNTGGGNNVAIGNEALRLKTSSNNVAVGHEALYTAGTGNNVAVGRHAGYATTSSSNTFVGYESGLSNTSGINTAVGHRSLRQNQGGGGNVAVGNDTMYYNNSGSYNVAVGNAANQANTSGSRNVCIGQQAGEYNTGTLVTAIGNQAAQGLNGNTNAGSYSVFVGSYAGQEINTGQVNTFLGYAAGQEVTTGGKNTLVGRYDGNAGGLDIRTASNNVVLSDGDGNIRLHVNSSGNAAIGAINSTYHKLHVAGATKIDATTKDSSITGGLVLQTPTYSEYHFTWSGNANHVVELTCASYFMAIVEYMTFQTNSGGDSNGIQEYHRGKWANNHTTHTWHEFESSGSTTSISNSISAGANTTAASGKLTISETYGSGSYAGANLVVKIYFGEAGFDISKTT